MGSILRWGRECIAKVRLQRGRVGRSDSSGIIKLSFLDEECHCQLLALLSRDGLLVLMRSEVEVRDGLGATA